MEHLFQTVKSQGQSLDTASSLRLPSKPHGSTVASSRSGGWTGRAFEDHSTINATQRSKFKPAIATSTSRTRIPPSTQSSTTASRLTPDSSRRGTTTDLDTSRDELDFLS